MFLGELQGDESKEGMLEIKRMNTGEGMETRIKANNS
jgi:hypothetical protein